VALNLTKIDIRPGPPGYMYFVTLCDTEVDSTDVIDSVAENPTHCTPVEHGRVVGTYVWPFSQHLKPFVHTS
jgi:hypothetical protein